MNPLFSVETNFDRTNCPIVATHHVQAGVMGECLRQRHLYDAVALVSLPPTGPSVNVPDDWVRFRPGFSYFGAVVQTPT